MASSQLPKLRLITGARLWLTIYCAESVTPSVVLVEPETTRLTAAPFATAPDHSTSSMASPCSPVETIPGSGPFKTIVGLLRGRPNLLRNVCTSERWIFVRPTIAIDWPDPLIELAYSGATL